MGTRQIECVVKFDEKLTKELNCFITTERMNLSNRDTKVKKLPIIYEGKTYNDNVSFPAGITSATIKFEVEKGLDYYFFGCHKDGSGPIFEFDDRAALIIED